MADITKKVDCSIPSNQRSQSFTHLEAPVGSLVLVKNSLGRVAKRINITDVAGGHLDFQLNVRRTVYPDREDSTFQHGMAKNLGQGVTLDTSNSAEIVVPVSTDWEMIDEMQISDISILASSTATAYTILVC